MEKLIDWLTSNVSWIFSGIGVFIVGLIIYNKAKKKSISQNIKNNSFGIQAGRDIEININEK